METRESVIKLHARFFDWHTLAYLLYAVAVILAFVAAALATRYVIIKNYAAKNATPVQEKVVDASSEQIGPEETKKPGDNPFAASTEQTEQPAAIDTSTIKLRVLNGNGVTGDGAKAKKQLEDAGFTVSAVANAQRQDYSTTQVYYVAGKKDHAQLVADALKAAGRTVQLEEASADLVGENTEVLVVTGKT